MGDRQDIDALLIGALYGELEDADKARLEAHLAAHPADRAAMDDLAATRSQVRSSLARMPEADPAPAISALLLQEAARRAPRKAGGGVLAWLSGLFRPMMAHPAMAGALALALVGGAAGVLYVNGKHTVAEPTVSATGGEAAPVAAAPTGSAASPPRADDQRTLQRDSYQVGLADDNEKAKATERLAVAGSGAAAGSGSAAPAQGDDTWRAGDGLIADVGSDNGVDAKHALAKDRAPAAHGDGKPVAKPAAKNRGYVAVETADPQLKTLDEDSAQVAQTTTGAAGPAPTTTATAMAPGAGATGGAPGQTGEGGRVASPPPPVAAGATPTPAPAYDKAAAAKLDEWATHEHQRLIALVKAGNCTEAGKVGSELAARAPEYYAANVENDRAVRACKQYIDQAKRKKANEQQKSRARNAYAPDDLEAPAANN